MISLSLFRPCAAAILACGLLLGGCVGSSTSPRMGGDEVVPQGTPMVEPPSQERSAPGLEERNLSRKRAPASGPVQVAARAGREKHATDARAAAPAAAGDPWKWLGDRLARDGLSGPGVEALLAGLPAPTQAPMGRKMKEIYDRRFFPKPPPKTAAERYYRGVVTEESARKCRDFVAANAAAFDHAERRYGVPPHIASALLFVETRLGSILADVKENAFHTLASMAVSRAPETISQWLPKLKGHERRMDWIRQNMPKRADWAYNETRALVAYMLKHQVSPDRLPSSIYGAVGICQFMPSNIEAYGADGDGDGRVDLFEIPDAVASLANYLHRHGWRAGIDRARQHKALMAYNHSVKYADSILALGDLYLGNPVEEPGA